MAAHPALAKTGDLTRVERAIRFDYDVTKQQWIKTMPNVRLESAPFSKGVMRAAYRMVDLSVSEGHPNRYMVAKIALDRRVKVKQYFEDAMMQAQSQYWADEYNKRDPPKKVQFLTAGVMQLLDRVGKPVCGVERYVEGKYVKYSNNDGWKDDRRNTPHAFTHFTFESSGRKLLICDIQGVGDLYTDPQIHSIDGKGFGLGNNGYKGIHRFFETHQCNAICRHLGLPQMGGGSRPDWIGTLPKANNPVRPVLPMPDLKRLPEGMVDPSPLKKKPEHPKKSAQDQLHHRNQKQHHVTPGRHQPQGDPSHLRAQDLGAQEQVLVTPLNLPIPPPPAQFQHAAVANEGPRPRRNSDAVVDRTEQNRQHQLGLAVPKGAQQPQKDDALLAVARAQAMREAAVVRMEHQGHGPGNVTARERRRISLADVAASHRDAKPGQHAARLAQVTKQDAYNRNPSDGSGTPGHGIGIDLVRRLKSDGSAAFVFTRIDPFGPCGSKSSNSMIHVGEELTVIDDQKLTDFEDCKQVETLLRGPRESGMTFESVLTKPDRRIVRSWHVNRGQPFSLSLVSESSTALDHKNGSPAQRNGNVKGGKRLPSDEGMGSGLGARRFAPDQRHLANAEGRNQQKSMADEIAELKNFGKKLNIGRGISQMKNTGMDHKVEKDNESDDVQVTVVDAPVASDNEHDTSSLDENEDDCMESKESRLDEAMGWNIAEIQADSSPPTENSTAPSAPPVEPLSPSKQTNSPPVPLPPPPVLGDMEQFQQQSDAFKDGISLPPPPPPVTSVDPLFAGTDSQAAKPYYLQKVKAANRETPPPLYEEAVSSKSGITENNAQVAQVPKLKNQKLGVLTEEALPGSPLLHSKAGLSGMSMDVQSQQPSDPIIPAPACTVEHKWFAWSDHLGQYISLPHISSEALEAAIRSQPCPSFTAQIPGMGPMVVHGKNRQAVSAHNHEQTTTLLRGLWWFQLQDGPAQPFREIDAGCIEMAAAQGTQSVSLEGGLVVQLHFSPTDQQRPSQGVLLRASDGSRLATVGRGWTVNAAS